MADSGIWHLIRQGEGAAFVVAGDVIVGRSKQADLRVQEGYVSRRHARLWIDNGRLMVEDLGSANGTFLNGERLSQRVCLTPGDRVCFDETEFYVELQEPKPPVDPNATAHRPPGSADPDFRMPERPADWPGTALPPARSPAPAAAPTPAPAAPTAPAPPTDAPPPPPPPVSIPTAPYIAEEDIPVRPPRLTPTVPTEPSIPAASIPQRPPARSAGPTRPTESDFDLDEPDFDLTGANDAIREASPTGGASGAADAEPPSDFELTSAGAPLDLSIGQARPVDSADPVPPPTSATVVMAPDDKPGSPPPVSGTVVMTPGETPQAPPAANGPRGDSSGLLFLSGPEEGVLYELVEGRVTLGRASESDIRIDESSVSKRHAELLIQPGNCRIHDKSRSNGVFVNGNRVEDLVLNPGDVIRLGRIEMMFDTYEKLAAGGADEEGAPWVWLIGGFVGTAALAAAAYFGLQML